MKRRYNTINEEINRIKSLFTEERMFGNLVLNEENIKVGSGGKEVEALQNIINQTKGCDKVVVDGKFGPKTKKGVACLQNKIGATPDGIVGPKTVSKLISAKSKLNESLINGKLSNLINIISKFVTGKEINLNVKSKSLTSKTNQGNDNICEELEKLKSSTINTLKTVQNRKLFQINTTDAEKKIVEDSIKMVENMKCEDACTEKNITLIKESITAVDEAISKAEDNNTLGAANALIKDFRTIKSNLEKVLKLCEEFKKKKEEENTDTENTDAENTDAENTDAENTDTENTDAENTDGEGDESDSEGESDESDSEGESDESDSEGEGENTDEEDEEIKTSDGTKDTGQLYDKGKRKNAVKEVLSSVKVSKGRSRENFKKCRNGIKQISKQISKIGDTNLNLNDNQLSMLDWCVGTFRDKFIESTGSGINKGEVVEIYKNFGKEMPKLMGIVIGRTYKVETDGGIPIGKVKRLRPNVYQYNGDSGFIIAPFDSGLDGRKINNNYESSFLRAIGKSPKKYRIQIIQKGAGKNKGRFMVKER